MSVLPRPYARMEIGGEPIVPPRRVPREEIALCPDYVDWIRDGRFVVVRCLFGWLTPTGHRCVEEIAHHGPHLCVCGKAWTGHHVRDGSA